MSTTSRRIQPPSGPAAHPDGAARLARDREPKPLSGAERLARQWFMRQEQLPIRKIRYRAVIATGLLAFACSLVWYSPLLFGDIWTAYRGNSVGSTPAWTMLLAPLREIAAAVVLAHLIVRLTITDRARAALLAAALWLAFHAVGMAGAVLWDDMPWQLGLVHAGDWLMKMLLMAVVLSAWHKNP